MKYLKSAFILYVTLVFVQLLTWITLFFPDLYWISPLTGIIHMIDALDLDDALGIYLIFVYYILFLVPLFIIYIIILDTNKNRPYNSSKFAIFAILGIVLLILLLVFYYILYFLDTDTFHIFQPIYIIIGGIGSLVYYIVIFILPNIRDLVYYKIFRVGGFVLSYIINVFVISPFVIADNINTNTYIILTQTSNLVFGIISLLSFFFLKRYLENEQLGQFNYQEIAY